MPERLDYLGRFRNPSLQKDFVLYCLQQRSKFSVAIITLIILSWCFAESIVDSWYFSHDNDSDERNHFIYSMVSLILSAIALILCLLLSSSLLNSQHLTCSYVQIFFIITMNLIFIVKTIKIIQFDDPNCIPSQYNVFHQIQKYAPTQTDAYNSLLSEDFPENCPSNHSLSSLVTDSALFLMSLCPLLLMIVIYEPRLYLVLGCNIPTITLILYSRYSSIYPFIPALIPFIILALLPIELHYQRTQSFLNKRKIEIILHENEKNADITNATEMRHMIGNVAHDLKTPLSSFTNGLDLIKEILKSTQEKINSLPDHDKALTSECFTECFSSINSCLTNIRNTNSFMLMTINRCIDYTKASKGMKLIPKQETVNLREVMQFPIECMSNIQERIGIKLNSLSDEICSHIITDKQWLQENLLCLLSNAVKYSTEGSVTITVTLANTSKQLRDYISNNYNTTPSTIFRKSASSPYTKKIIPVINDLDCDGVQVGYLHFEIEDTGIGLSEEAMKNLFNPFKQAQRLAGGTGLGLYSLAKRMEALKGSYGVRRRKDGKQGSLFWFALPYRPDDALSAAVSMLDQSPKSNESTVDLFNKSIRSSNITGNESLEILIVDDSPSILKMAGMMIRRQGHKIWTAENGEIALHKIEEKWKETGKGFDLILMDLQMPVMDGLEATRRLRMMEREGRDWMVTTLNITNDNTIKTNSNDEYSKITPERTKGEEEGISICHQLIIGLSANSDHETCNDALMAGVDDFFAKPFSLDTFNKTITRYFYK